MHLESLFTRLRSIANSRDGAKLHTPPKVSPDKEYPATEPVTSRPSLTNLVLDPAMYGGLLQTSSTIAPSSASVDNLSERLQNMDVQHSGSGTGSLPVPPNTPAFPMFGEDAHGEPPLT